jgi:nitroreductase
MADDAPSSARSDVLAALLGLRQTRIYRPDPVPQPDLEQLLEVARWTGSAKNGQPWHLVVVTDQATNARLSQLGAFAQFLAGVPVSIVLAMDGTSRAVPYDEGRLSERVMLAASALGLGSGTAWFSTEDARQQVRDLLGIPEHLHPWSALGLGYPDASVTQPLPAVKGRRPLAEIVGWGRFGEDRPTV